MLAPSMKPTDRKQKLVRTLLNSLFEYAFLNNSPNPGSFIPVIYLYLTWHKPPYSDIFSQTRIPNQLTVVLLETWSPLLIRFLPSFIVFIRPAPQLSIIKTFACKVKTKNKEGKERKKPRKEPELKSHFCHLSYPNRSLQSLLSFKLSM